MRKIAEYSKRNYGVIDNGNTYEVLEKCLESWVSDIYEKFEKDNKVYEVSLGRDIFVFDKITCVCKKSHCTESDKYNYKTGVAIA